MSERLNIKQREHILERALRLALQDRKKAHKAATTALADALWEHEYSAAAKIAAKLPQAWVHSSSSIYIRSAGFKGRYEYGKEKMDCELPMSATRLVPDDHDHHNIIVVGGDHPFFERAQSLAEEFQAINREKERLTARIKSILYAVNTRAQLLEVWPEVAELLPPEQSPSRAVVPVELVPDLNKSVGLPSGRKGKK